jgi:ring-1,2-phenylacetyl-CoA epoxidase subunit PaaE
MFTEELADLKDRYPDRLHVVHVLSREPQEAELLSGRIDAERLGRLFDALLDSSTVDEWFLCGPYGLVTVRPRRARRARRARPPRAYRALPRDRVPSEVTPGAAPAAEVPPR